MLTNAPQAPTAPLPALYVPSAIDAALRGRLAAQRANGMVVCAGSRYTFYDAAGEHGTGHFTNAAVFVPTERIVREDGATVLYRSAYSLCRTAKANVMLVVDGVVKDGG